MTSGGARTIGDSNGDGTVNMMYLRIAAKKFGQKEQDCSP